MHNKNRNTMGKIDRSSTTGSTWTLPYLRSLQLEFFFPFGVPQKKYTHNPGEVSKRTCINRYYSNLIYCSWETDTHIPNTRYVATRNHHADNWVHDSRPNKLIFFQLQETVAKYFYPKQYAFKNNMVFWLHSSQFRSSSHSDSSVQQIIYDLFR